MFDVIYSSNIVFLQLGSFRGLVFFPFLDIVRSLQKLIAKADLWLAETIKNTYTNKGKAKIDQI